MNAQNEITLPLITFLSIVLSAFFINVANKLNRIIVLLENVFPIKEYPVNPDVQLISGQGDKEIFDIMVGNDISSINSKRRKQVVDNSKLIYRNNGRYAPLKNDLPFKTSLGLRSVSDSSTDDKAE